MSYFLSRFFDTNYSKKLVSIAFLRCIATILITNTHLDQVYPTDKMAIGGLIGDVLFFMISGYCLIDSRPKNFASWYIKRFFRVYPAVLIMILINLRVGFFSFSRSANWFYGFVYPTFYDFAGAILLLYIPFYFVKRYINKPNHLLTVILVIGISGLVYYILGVDTSQYVMNDVANRITLFLYFESMLLGALFKRTVIIGKDRTKAAWLGVALALIAFVCYTAAYLLITRNPALYGYQIIINVILLAATAILFVSVLKLEPFFRKFNHRVLQIVYLLSTLTLELYVVQRVIIMNLQEIVFPVNLLLIIVAVIAAALLLHIVTGAISKSTHTLLSGKKGNSPNQS